MESKNLIIRESLLEDCEFFACCEAKPEIAKWFSIDEGYSYEDVVNTFNARREVAGDSELQYTVTLKDGEPIGRLYAPINRERNRIHIDWIYIDREHQRKGYGRETIELFLNYCFNELNLEKVGIDHFVGHDIADSMYKKIGFSVEGTLRHHTKKNGVYMDLVFMSMLRDEFFARDMGGGR